MSTAAGPLGIAGRIHFEARAWPKLPTICKRHPKTLIRKLDAETGQIHVDSGAIGPEEERARIAADPGTRYPGIDPNDVPDLKEEEEEGLEPKGWAAALAEGGSEQDDSEAGRQDA